MNRANQLPTGLCEGSTNSASHCSTALAGLVDRVAEPKVRGLCVSIPRPESRATEKPSEPLPRRFRAQLSSVAHSLFEERLFS